MTERNGNWFQTYTGHKFWSLDPKPEDVYIEDIAHSLSLICRFNGHTQCFYSVAQHSILVAGVFGRLIEGTELVDIPKAYLCALLHDATEAYCGDMISPIKCSMPDYVYMEKQIWHCILERFKLKEAWVEHHIEKSNFLGEMRRYVYGYVKRADRILLVTERRDLLTDGPGREKNDWVIEEHVDPDPTLINPLPSFQAKRMFLDLFNKLGG